MSRIAEVAHQVVARKYAPYEEKPGMCLRTTREMIQRALGLTYEDFYGTYRSGPVGDNDTGIPWARDVQQTLRGLDLTVPLDELQAGDIVCNWRLGNPQGHIGIMLTDRLIVENTGSQRGIRISGYNRLSPLDEWPYQEAIEVFRLED